MASTTIQIRPHVTCRPCVPTSVKNDDRNALRLGPAPSAIRCENSRSSSTRNDRPSRNVTPSQKSNAPLRFLYAPSIAKPYVILDSSSIVVSSATPGISNRSLPVGPPANWWLITANTANSDAKMMQSVIRYSQKPNTEYDGG